MKFFLWQCFITSRLMFKILFTVKNVWKKQNSVYDNFQKSTILTYTENLFLKYWELVLKEKKSPQSEDEK